MKPFAKNLRSFLLSFLDYMEIPYSVPEVSEIQYEIVQLNEGCFSFPSQAEICYFENTKDNHETARMTYTNILPCLIHIFSDLFETYEQAQEKANCFLRKVASEDNKPDKHTISVSIERQPETADGENVEIFREDFNTRFDVDDFMKFVNALRLAFYSDSEYYEWLVKQIETTAHFCSQTESTCILYFPGYVINFI